MNHAHDLETLRKLRAQEIHNLHLTYLRTKRTVIRATSPSRLIRQNVAASLSIAATVGLLIAPQAGSPPPLHNPAETSPPAAISAPEKSARKHPLLRTLLTEAGAFLLSKIDLHKLITLALETFTHSANQDPPLQPSEDPSPIPTNNLDDFE